MNNKKIVITLGKFKENLSPGVNNGSFSDIKKLLVNIGFHHTWQCWISNQNKSHRIKIETSENKIYLDLTKKKYFNLNNYIISEYDRMVIDKKNINLDNIKSQLVQYFN